MRFSQQFLLLGLYSIKDSRRLLSVRAFDKSGMMIDADVIDGERLESLIEHMLENKSADYLHIHNAKLGCYAALVERG